MAGIARGAYGLDGRCSSSDCDDVIYNYNNAWGSSEHGFRPDNPTDASWQGQGFVMNEWSDPTNYINTYPWGKRMVIIFHYLSLYFHCLLVPKAMTFQQTTVDGEDLRSW